MDTYEAQDGSKRSSLNLVQRKSEHQPTIATYNSDR